MRSTFSATPHAPRCSRFPDAGGIPLHWGLGASTADVRRHSGHARGRRPRLGGARERRRGAVVHERGSRLRGWGRSLQGELRTRTWRELGSGVFQCPLHPGSAPRGGEGSPDRALFLVCRARAKCIEAGVTFGCALDNAQDNPRNRCRWWLWWGHFLCGNIDTPHRALFTTH